MAAFGSVASATAAAATQVTVTKPASLAAGDLMVAFITEGNSSGTPDTPSGWTLIGSAVDIGSAGNDTFCFAKIASAGDAAASDFTFTYSGSNTRIEGILYRITGTFASTANINAKAFNSAGTEPSADVFRFSPGITPYQASSVLLMHVHGIGSSVGTITTFEVQTSNPSWTEDVDTTESGATNRRIGSAHASRTEITDTGYFQVTFSANITGAGGVLLAINDTQNGTATPSVISLTSTVNTPVSTGAANVTATVISMTSTINSPTATGGTNDALWKNTDKPSAPTITNITKT